MAAMHLMLKKKSRPGLTDTVSVNGNDQWNVNGQ